MDIRTLFQTLRAYLILIASAPSCVYHGDMFPSPESPIRRDWPAMIETLCTARKLYAYGPVVDYFVEKNLIGFVRLGDEKHLNGCVVVMCNLPEEYVALSETSISILSRY